MLLLIIWKSNLSSKIKQDFFQAVAVSILLYGCTTWTLTKCMEKKTKWELHKNATCCFEQILVAKWHKTAAVWPHTSHLTDHPNMISKTYRALLKKQGWTHKQCFFMDPYIWTHTAKDLITSAIYGHWM